MKKIAVSLLFLVVGLSVGIWYSAMQQANDISPLQAKPTIDLQPIQSDIQMLGEQIHAMRSEFEMLSQQLGVNDRSQEPDTSGDHSQSEEAMALSSIPQLEAHYLQENRDAQWAAQKEAMIRNMLMDMERYQGLQLSDIDCRRQSCKLEIDIDTTNSTPQTEALLMDDIAHFLPQSSRQRRGDRLTLIFAEAL